MISIQNDSSRPEGGYALLAGPGLEGVTAVSIENRSLLQSEYLQEDGKWGRQPFAFPVEATGDGSLRLGPHIVAYVDGGSLIAVHSQDGTEIGSVYWDGIIPPRDPNWRKVAMRPSPTPPPPPPPRPPPPMPTPSRSRKRWWGLALIILALAIGAGALLWRTSAPVSTEPRIDADQRASEPPPAPPTPPPPAPPAPPPPAPPPTPPSPPAPTPTPPPGRVDCGSFATRLAGLSGISDRDKVELGEEAMKAECPAEAFRAFDSSDWQSSEPAAWNLARFYDPNETSPVYRRVAAVDAAAAAYYYHEWRDRSPRQAEALAKICANNRGGGASLQRSCAR